MWKNTQDEGGMKDQQDRTGENQDSPTTMRRDVGEIKIWVIREWRHFQHEPSIMWFIGGSFKRVAVLFGRNWMWM